MWQMPLPQLGKPALRVEGSVVAQHLIEPPGASVCASHTEPHIPS